MLRYPDWLSTVQAKENSAPIVGVEKGGLEKHITWGPNRVCSQTRNGVTWLAKVGAARSDRGGPLAPWPQITTIMIMVTNTFRIARRAIPGGISCRHKNAKCRVNGVGVKGRLVGTTGSCWVAGCSEGSMSWHVEITDADDTHKDGSVQVE